MKHFALWKIFISPTTAQERTMERFVGFSLHSFSFLAKIQVQGIQKNLERDVLLACARKPEQPRGSSAPSHTYSCFHTRSCCTCFVKRKSLLIQLCLLMYGLDPVQRLSLLPAHGVEAIPCICKTRAHDADCCLYELIWTTVVSPIKISVYYAYCSFYSLAEVSCEVHCYKLRLSQSRSEQEGGGNTDTQEAKVMWDPKFLQSPWQSWVQSPVSSSQARTMDPRQTSPIKLTLLISFFSLFPPKWSSLSSTSQRSTTLQKPPPVQNSISTTADLRSSFVPVCLQISHCCNGTNLKVTLFS